ERARLHDELGRFGNGHEVAAHVGMGHQHRPPGLDLPEKRRDHAATTTKDVAETHRHEVAAVLDGGLLHNQLGDTLSEAHYAAGTHRLVGGHADEVLRPGLDRGRDDIEGSEHVVEDCLADVGLHQRHVLVRGRMEYGARLVG